MNWTGLFHLLVVYIVWGSTYLAIRLTVREGAGFPPFTMGATRLLVAGGLLLLWTAWMRKRLKVSTEELLVLAITGVLLWVGGNGMVVWAEQHADSGYAALLVGTLPIWVVLIESFLERRVPSLLLTLSLLIGFAGTGLLTLPVLMAGAKADLLSVIALLIAPISFGAGSILQRRRPLDLDPLVGSGYQQIFGGLVFGMLAFIFQEPPPNPTPEAWWAWGYLVVVGSIFAFTSFLLALRMLPTSIVMTYAYVNPVIAMILGWAILDESITAWTIAGSALVLLGVAGVFRDRYAEPPRVTDPAKQTIPLQLPAADAVAHNLAKK